VQFHCVGDAQSFRICYHGDCRKNNTTHVEFRPDLDMDECLGPAQSSPKESIKLFVAKTNDTTAAEICDAVAPTVLNDVQLIGGFTLTFPAAEDAVALIDALSNGVRIKGDRYIYSKAPGLPSRRSP
jgi:hypothetical protein